jgi:hypothetical protein
MYIEISLLAASLALVCVTVHYFTLPEKTHIYCFSCFLTLSCPSKVKSGRKGSGGWVGGGGWGYEQTEAKLSIYPLESDLRSTDPLPNKGPQMILKWATTFNFLLSQAVIYLFR